MNTLEKMYKLATLLKNKESSLGTDYDLDVCVQKKDFNSQEDAKSGISNTPEQSSMGTKCFFDTRDSKEIIMDFAFKNRQCLRIGESKDGIYSFARYQKQLEPFIISSFVNYFSDDRG